MMIKQEKKLCDWTRRRIDGSWFSSCRFCSRRCVCVYVCERVARRRTGYYFINKEKNNNNNPRVARPMRNSYEVWPSVNKINNKINKCGRNGRQSRREMDSHFGVGINEHMHIDRSDGSDGAQCETEVHADERREKATNGCDFSAARMFCNYEILSIYYFFFCCCLVSSRSAASAKEREKLRTTEIRTNAQQNGEENIRFMREHLQHGNWKTRPINSIDCIFTRFTHENVLSIVWPVQRNAQLSCIAPIVPSVCTCRSISRRRWRCRNTDNLVKKKTTELNAERSSVDQQTVNRANVTSDRVKFGPNRSLRRTVCKRVQHCNDDDDHHDDWWWPLRMQRNRQCNDSDILLLLFRHVASLVSCRQIRASKCEKWTMRDLHFALQFVYSQLKAPQEEHRHNQCAANEWTKISFYLSNRAVHLDNCCRIDAVADVDVSLLLEQHVNTYTWMLQSSLFSSHSRVHRLQHQLNNSNSNELKSNAAIIAMHTLSTSIGIN